MDWKKIAAGLGALTALGGTAGIPVILNLIEQGKQLAGLKDSLASANGSSASLQKKIDDLQGENLSLTKQVASCSSGNATTLIVRDAGRFQSLGVYPSNRECERVRGLVELNVPRASATCVN